MTDPAALILRIAHIFCGVFWAGAALMLAAFIEPATMALGPVGGKFMERLMGPLRFGLFMTAAAVITAASGLVLLWIGAGGNLTNWWGSAGERAIVVGSVAGLAALVWGLAVNAPTAARLAGIAREIEASGGPPRDAQTAEVSRLQRRLHVGGYVSATMLSASVIAMAAAHYL